MKNLSEWRMNVRPTSGLSLAILKEFMTKRELKELIDKYVAAKRKKYAS